VATIEDFERLDIRAGTVIEVEDFPEARKPAYKLVIDFGPLGTRRSSAQITHYARDELLGRQVVAVVNFPPRRVAGFISEVLVLGVPLGEHDARVILLQPERTVQTGAKVY
jgi:tRNA-binding protein